MKPIRTLWLVSGILVLLVLRASGAITFETLYSFGYNTNALGANPYELMRGQDGNFYGGAFYGGANGYGTIYRITPAGVLTTLHSFNGVDGVYPYGKLVQDANGVLYGTTLIGGANGGFGTVFKLTTNGVFSSLISFTNFQQQGNRITPGLVLGTNGLLYGLATEGGSGILHGTFFVTDTNGAMSTLASFAFTNGSQPYTSLMQATDGNFYGTTTGGGSNGLGTIFRATTNGTLTSMISFRGTNGNNPRTTLVQGQDGDLYGATTQGGEGGVSGEGMIFKMTLGGAFTRLYSFTGFNNGMTPEVILQGTDGHIYGTTSFGGTNNGVGTVFRLTTNGVLTSLYSFGATIAAYPRGLVQNDDGVLYGAGSGGGSNAYGSIFKITTNGAITSVFSFQNPFGTDGSEPSKLVQGPGGLYYGVTGEGGIYGYGTVFSMTTNGIMTRLYSFTGGIDGYQPSSLLAAKDGQLYGTTRAGGTNFSGTIFRITTTGTLTTLHSFNGDDDGEGPTDLLQGIDDNLYGVARDEGTNSSGTIFKMTLTGTFTPLASLPGGEGGSAPVSLLQRNDGTFYGLAANGGTNDSGTIFRLTPAGAFSTIFAFDSNINGYDPRDLAQGPDGNLYGTAQGGVNGFGYGVIFKVTTNGAFTHLHTFTDTVDGYYPTALTLGSDGNFYATTLSGGTNGSGTLFRIKTNGTYTLLHVFNEYTEGSTPVSLVQAKDFSFYGTAESGGTNGSGAFFHFSVPNSPSIIIQPASVTNHAGTVATFTVESDGILPLKYQWRKNLINLTNGGNVSGATSPTLSLNNVSAADAGSYSVVITNNFGSTTSSNATLTVLPGLAEALDTTNLVWTTGGDANWFGQPWTTHDGTDAAQSSIILDSEEVWMQTTVNGPGVLTFWWKVSSEGGYDFLNFYVNDQLTAFISGETDWQQRSINLASGGQPLLWSYEKDFSFSFGADRGWVDQVSFVPGSPPAPVFQQIVRSNNFLNLGWSTVSGHLYQLQYTTNLVQTNWINLGSPATNGSMSTPIGPDRQRFYRVLLLP